MRGRPVHMPGSITRACANGGHGCGYLHKVIRLYWVDDSQT